MKIPFGEQAYATRSLNANAQELINLYPEINPPFAKDQIVTYPTPGNLFFMEVGAGPIRGMIEFNGDLYAISGAEFYRINAGGVATLLGTVAGTTRVGLARNDLEIIIVNGTQGYTFSESAGFAQITDLDFIQAKVVGYLSRRFILPRINSNQFNVSDAFDGTSYDGGNFTTVITNPENIVTMLTDHSELWLFAEKSINIWIYNQQELEFPFTEVQGASIEKGCAAAFTPVKLDSTIYWLGNDQSIYSALGYKPVRISTPAIDKAIRRYPTTADAFAYGYHEEGHPFYVITFPSGNETWVYDASIQDPYKAWHQRRSGLSGRYRANAYAYAFENHYIGDYQSGKIFETSLDHFLDDGALIVRVATSPVIHGKRKRVFMDRLEVDIESGVGLTTGQGENPEGILTYSDDGGRTWSKDKRGLLGKKGEYTHRMKFHNLGSFYQRIFKLTITDPVRTVILDAEAMADVEQ